MTTRVWMLGCFLVLIAACDSKEKAKEAMTPEAICAKHAKEDPASCAKEMSELKAQLGEKSWNTFASCAADAEDEASMGVCLMKVQVMEERGETATSPAAICEKHGKEDPARCATELEQLKKELGPAWKDFALCAAKAEGEEALGQCIVKVGKKTGEL